MLSALFMTSVAEIGRQLHDKTLPGIARLQARSPHPAAQTQGCRTLCARNSTPIASMSVKWRMPTGVGWPERAQGG